MLHFFRKKHQNISNSIDFSKQKILPSRIDVTKGCFSKLIKTSSMDDFFHKLVEIRKRYRHFRFIVIYIHSYIYIHSHQNIKQTKVFLMFRTLCLVIHNCHKKNSPKKYLYKKTNYRCYSSYHFHQYYHEQHLKIL